ncbi:LysR family transcriptional regulator [Litoribrevibacter albus]|uniref:LysR family transcriptional regulator n=1 Tax=Litoribrevibacter albus TaxID=1473156 RepID=A0AA37SCH8_9GAMM|nr:LysR family transcriptional regulator [Litoribrevibacter albus]GLQ32134.1 LysR family transcriptional regulator [Litoribrevibacter albus]
MRTNDFTTLKLLAIFVTVIESGSFAEAARRLHSSRSRISEQVAQLEQHLGIRLIQRSTRKLSITPEGQEIYDEAQQLPQLLNKVDAIASPQTPKGRVRITMNTDIAVTHFIPALDDFHKAFPDVEIDLIADDYPLDLIEETIDLAIRIGFPKDDSLIARPMFQESFGIFCSPDFLKKNIKGNAKHIDKFGTPQSIEELEQLRWVILDQSSSNGLIELMQDQQKVIIRPKTYDKCNSPMAMQHMIKAGQGVGLLLPTTVREAIEQQSLIQLFPDIQSTPLVFSLVYPSRKQVPLRVRCLIDFLMERDIFRSPLKE